MDNNDRDYPGAGVMGTARIAAVPEERLIDWLGKPFPAGPWDSSHELLTRVENHRGSWTVTLSGTPSPAYLMRIINFFEREHSSEGLGTLRFNAGTLDAVGFGNVAGSPRQNNLSLLGALAYAMKHAGKGQS